MAVGWDQALELGVGDRSGSHTPSGPFRGVEEGPSSLRGTGEEHDWYLPCPFSPGNRRNICIWIVDSLQCIAETSITMKATIPQLKKKCAWIQKDYE